MRARPPIESKLCNSNHLGVARLRIRMTFTSYPAPSKQTPAAGKEFTQEANSVPQHWSAEERTVLRNTRSTSCPTKHPPYRSNPRFRAVLRQDSREPT